MRLFQHTSNWVKYENEGYTDLHQILREVYKSSVFEDVRKFDVVQIGDFPNLFMVPNYCDLYVKGTEIKDKDRKLVATYWCTKNRKFVKVAAGKLNENGIPFLEEEWPDFGNLQEGQRVIYFHPKDKRPVEWVVETRNEYKGAADWYWLRSTVDSGEYQTRVDFPRVDLRPYQLTQAYKAFCQPLRLYKCKGQGVVWSTEDVECEVWAADEGAAGDFLEEAIKAECDEVYPDGYQSIDDVTPEFEAIAV